MVSRHDNICVTNLCLAGKKVRLYSGQGSSKLKEKRKRSWMRGSEGLWKAGYRLWIYKG